MAKRLGHVVVTGGAGYLGAELVRQLAERRWDITVVDDLSAGRADALGAADNFVRLDVRDHSALYALLTRKRTDAVVHLAGWHDEERSIARPEAFTEVNVGGAAALLSAMRAANVDRLVLSSSLAVLGAPPQNPAAEDAPVRPITPYGRNLAAVEALLQDCGTAWGLRSAALRLGFVAGHSPASGRRAPAKSRVAALVDAAKRRHPGHVFALTGTRLDDGTHHSQVIDLLHVSDAAAALAAGLDLVHDGPAESLVAHVGTGRGVDLERLLSLAEERAGGDIPHRWAELRPGEPAIRVGDPARFHKLTGWRAESSEPAAVVASVWGD